MISGKKNLLVLFVFLFLLGCQKDNRSDDTIKGPTNETALTVKLADGFSLDIPAGAMEKGLKISLNKTAVGFPDEGSVLQEFELLPEGTRFNKPVTLTFNYTDEMLGGNSPFNVGLAFKDDKDGKWYSLIGGKIDPVKKTISVKITHFSKWAYFSGIHLYMKVNERLSRDNEINLPMLTSQRAEVCVVMDLPPLSSDEEMIKIIEKVGEILKRDPVNPASTENCPDCPLLAPVKFIPPVSVDDIHNQIIKPDKWMVNGITNGNNTVGKIEPFTRNVFTYNSPAKMPLDNPIAITAVINTVSHGQLQIVQQTNVYARKWRYEVARISSDECDGIDDFSYAYKVSWGGGVDFTISDNFTIASAQYKTTPLKILQAGNCTCMSGIKLEPLSNTGVFLSKLRLKVSAKPDPNFPFQIVLNGDAREYGEFKATWTTDNCGADYPHTETSTTVVAEDFTIHDFPFGWLPLTPVKTKLDEEGDVTIVAIE